MDTHCAKLPPDDPRNNERRQKIKDFWNELRTCGDPGATTWEVLDPLERQVTECLDRDSPNIVEAESKTALAFLLIAGCSDT